ncbi:MAG: lipocalin family protein [Victivallales bacterium]|nr:lipocalin family protein [Victivallales bacterium]
MAIMVLGMMLMGCANMTQVDNSVASSFDLNRYLGEWFEIARFDHTFERGIEEAKATYSLRPDGKVEVQNSGVKDGKSKTAKGVGKTTDTPGLLRVTFFWPFYADYRVMAIDDAYTAALVGSGSADYLWILSRTPRLTPQKKETLLSEAARRGYDTSKLLWIRQKE